MFRILIIFLDTPTALVAHKMDDELLSIGITDVSLTDISEPEIESMDGGAESEGETTEGAESEGETTEGAELESETTMTPEPSKLSHIIIEQSLSLLSHRVTHQRN